MKACSLLISCLILAGVIAAGCSGTQTASPSVPTAAPATGSPAATPTASLTLGDSYLGHPTPFSFTGQKEPYTAEFRIPQGQPWGLEFHVNPTNEDPQYTWFTITLTNLDTGQSDTYGYGRENGFEKDRTYRMYGSGPYKVEMNGNRVSVTVNIAKIKS